MADLSFIEDSVAFPEKEEDEEEEEEGVEWGYEEGNPPHFEVAGVPGRRVRGCASRVFCPALGSAHFCSLALRAPPRPLFPTWVPVTFPFPRPVSGQKAQQGERAGLPPAFGLGSLAFLPGSCWHLPSSGGQALKLQLCHALPPE